jgi:hypothetical protein
MEFELVEEKPRTKVFAVMNKKNEFRLGIIKWYGAWRQYCFFPSEQTVFSVGCMTDINNFIAELMNEYKDANDKEYRRY